jgi:phospholipid/cholesterol/gamma-HCH transport system substrate-binding protein
VDAVKRALRTYWLPVGVIVGFAFVSTVLGVEILGRQRLQSPFAPRYSVRVAFSATPGLAPGLGQPAEVAGVPVGEIADAVSRDGQTVVTLSIDRSQLPRVYGDATATLVPVTPLDNLAVEIDPGGPPSPPLTDGATIPVASSTVPAAADDLLDALDGDTRTYLAALISATGDGLHGHGPDLRALLAQIGPTARQIRELSGALAARRATLAQVVHSLSVLAVAAGRRDAAIRQAVSAGSATLTAMASQDAALRQSLALLPGTLRRARGALTSAAGLAGALDPALTALRPAIARLPRALAATTRLARTATPELRDVIRPLVRVANGDLPALTAAAGHLGAVTPDLDNAFRVLEYALDELFYSNGGRSRSYGFYAAWAQHDGNSVLSTGDAQGQVIRSALIVSCSELNQIPNLTSLVNGIAALLPGLCPPTGSAH